MAWVWTALVAALVITLGACAALLIRKGIRLFSALGEFFGTSAILDGVHRPEPESRVFAVLESPGVVRAHREQLLTATAERKAERSRRRMDRAYGLVRADPGQIATRLTGLDSTRRRVGETVVKDDHHVE